MSISDRLDFLLSPPACPICGNEDRLFLRHGNELVCRTHFPRHMFGPRPDGRNEDIRTTARPGPQGES